MAPPPPTKNKTDLLRDKPAVMRKGARPPRQQVATGYGSALAQDVSTAHAALVVGASGAELSAVHAGALQRTVGNRATGEVMRMAAPVPANAISPVRMAAVAAGAMLARRNDVRRELADEPFERIEPETAPVIERKPMAEPPPPPPADAATAGDPPNGGGGSVGAPDAPADPPSLPDKVQAKLSVGAVNDPLEAEADAMAQRVMRSTTPGALLADKRQDAVRRTVVQRAPVGMAGGEVDPSFERQLQHSKGGGTKLPDAVRSKMEHGFEADFDSVRVHTGEQSDTLNRSISAQAFTHGSDVYFDAGKYQPSTTHGQTLLAHELTHVVQQGGAGVRRKRTAEQNIQRTSGGGSYSVLSMHLSANSLRVVTNNGTFSFGAFRSPNLPDGEYEVATSKGANGVITAQFLKVIKSKAGKDVVLDFTSFGASNPKDKSLPQLDQVFANPFSGVLTVSNGKQAAMTFNEFGAGSGTGTGGSGADDTSGDAKTEGDGGIIAPPVGKVEGDPGADGQGKTAPKEGDKTGPPKFGDGIEDSGGETAATDPPFPSDIVGPDRAPIGGTTTYKHALRFMENYQSLLVGVTNAMRVQYRIEVYDVSHEAKTIQLEADRKRAGLSAQEAGTSDPSAQSSTSEIMSPSDPNAQSDPGSIVDQTTPLMRGSSNLPYDGKPLATGNGNVDAKALDASVRSRAVSDAAVVGRTDAAQREFGRVGERLDRDWDQTAKEQIDEGGEARTDDQMLARGMLNFLGRFASGTAKYAGATASYVVDAAVMNTQWEVQIPWLKEGDYVVRAIAAPPAYTTPEGETRRRAASVATKWVRVSDMSKIGARAQHDDAKQSTDLDAELLKARAMLGNPELSSVNAEKVKAYIAELEKRIGAYGNSVTQIRLTLETKRKELAELKAKGGDHPLLTRDLDKAIRALEIQLTFAQERETALGGDAIRPRVSIVSDITGETYPLMLQLAFREEANGFVATLSDVSTKAGRLYYGNGSTKEAAAWSAITALSGHNEYGRGVLVARMPQNTGFAKLEASMSNDPRDTQLIRETLTELSQVLGVLAMVVQPLAIPAMLVGAAASADRLMMMWNDGTLKYNQLEAFNEILNILTVATSGISAIGNLQVVTNGKSVMLRGMRTLGTAAGAVEMGISTFQISFGSAQFVAQFMDIRRKVAAGEMSHADARRQMAQALNSQFMNVVGGALAMRGAIEHANQRSAAKSAVKIKELEVELALDVAIKQLQAESLAPPAPKTVSPSDAAAQNGGNEIQRPVNGETAEVTMPPKSPEVRQAETAVTQSARSPGVPDADSNAPTVAPGGKAHMPEGTPTLPPDAPTPRATADPNEVTQPGTQPVRSSDPNEATLPGTQAVHIPTPLEALGMAALKHGRELAGQGKLPRGMTPEIYTRRILGDAIEHRGNTSDASFNNRAMMMADLLGNPQSIVREGLMAGNEGAIISFLKLHGNWKQAMEMLSKEGSGDMQRIAGNIKAYRDGVVKELVTKFNLDTSGSLSSEAISDVDLATTGPNAGRLMIEAEQHMAQKYGMDWLKISEMLRMNFYTEAGRLTQYEGSFAKLSGRKQAEVQNELVGLTEQLSFAKMLHHAGDNPQAVARVREVAKQVGFNLDSPAVKELVNLSHDPAKTLERRNELLMEIDGLKQKHDEAANDSARSDEVATLALQITRKQMEANFHTVEAYTSPGAGRSVVAGIKVRGPEAYESALGQLEMIEHHIKENGYDTVAAFREYMFAKYITRYLEPAKAAGVSGPMVSYFEHMAQYVYKQNREAMNRAAHLWQSENINDLGSAVPVTPEFLRSQYNDWRGLVLETLPQIRANAMADPNAWTPPKPAKGAKRTNAAGEKPVVPQETPGVFKEAALTLGPDAAVNKPITQPVTTSQNRSESGVIVNGRFESRRTSGEVQVGERRGRDGSIENASVAREVFGTAEAPLRPARSLDRSAPMSSAGFAGSVAGVKGFGVFKGTIINSAGAMVEVAIKVGRKYDHKDPRHTGEPRNLTPQEQVRFDSEAKIRQEKFLMEVQAAKAMGDTGSGPKCYGEVDVGDPLARAFAMEIVSGSFYEFMDNAEASANPAVAARQQAEAANAAGAITPETVRGLQIYGQKLLDGGWYYAGEVQGLIGADGSYAPIDAGGLIPLPTVDASLPPDVQAARRSEREHAIASHWSNIDAERISLLNARADALHAKAEAAVAINPRSDDAKRLAVEAKQAQREAENARDASFVPVAPREKALYDMRQMVRAMTSGMGNDLSQPAFPTERPGARPADAAITKPEQVNHAPDFHGISTEPARRGTEIPEHPLLGQPEAEYDRVHRNNDISDYDADTFGGSKYVVITLQKPVTVYRAGKFDPAKPLAKHLGRFFAMSKPRSELQARLDLAARVKYIGFEDNIVDMDSSFTVEIAAGTKVYVGRAGDQIAPFFGGTEQIFVPDAWTNPGVRVVEHEAMVKWREWQAKNKKP